MRRHAVVTVLLVVLGTRMAPIAADEIEAPAPTVDELVERARADHAQGRHAAALAGLAEAYALEPRPSLLFAMGQMEFNLEHYGQAIARYEQYLATHPEPADVELAIQAIAVARDRIAAPPQPPQPPAETIVKVVPRPVDRLAWTLAISGGTSALAAGALYLTARQQAGNVSGRYADYVDRVDRARDLRIASIAFAGVGATLAALATIRWLADSDAATDTARPPPRSRPTVSLAGDPTWVGVSISGSL